MPSHQEKEFTPMTNSFLRNKRSSNCSKGCRKNDKVELPQVETKKPTCSPGLDPNETEFEEMIKHIDREFSDIDSMWLSSNSTSSTFLSLDSLDHLDSDVLDLYLSKRLSSMSSICESFSNDSYDDDDDDDDGTPVSDKYNVGTIDSTPIVVNTHFEDPEHNTSNKFVLSADTIQVEDNVSSAIRSESGGFSSECPQSPSSSVSTIPATPTSHEDWVGRIFDRTNIWVSSLDLEAEDSQLTPDEKQGFDFTDFEFPSPFKFTAMRDLENQSLVSYCSTRQKSDTRNVVKEPDSDEPLFWPFDENSYKNLDFEKFLSLSPRKSGKAHSIPVPHGSKTVKSALPKNNKSKKCKESIEGARRKIDFSVTSNSATPYKRVGYGCGVQRIVATPPRLTKSARVASCQNPGSVLKKKGLPKSKGNALRKNTTDEPSGQHEEIELDLVRGISIEKMLGLNEFDGHEGIDD